MHADSIIPMLSYLSRDVTFINDKLYHDNNNCLQNTLPDNYNYHVQSFEAVGEDSIQASIRIALTRPVLCLAHFGQLLRYADQHIVHTMNVFIDRNNLQVELRRFIKMLEGSTENTTIRMVQKADSKKEVVVILYSNVFNTTIVNTKFNTNNRSK